MNILFYYSSSIDPMLGGIQRVTLFLGEYLRQIGHNVYYVSAKRNSDKENDNQYYFPNEKRNSEENKDFYFHFLEEKKIQIFINQSGISPLHQEVLDWTNEYGIKLITVFHNSLFGMYGLAGHCDSMKKWISRLRLTKLIDNLLLQAFRCKYGKHYQNIYIKSDKIVTLSDKFYNEIIYFSKVKEVDLPKICYLPNPLTIGVSEGGTKTKTLLFVGRFAYQKRIDLLLEIWNKLYIKYPDWQLVLVGDGDLRKELEKVAKEKEIKNICFKGYCSPEPFYEEAQIFCMTSAFEGFGLVLLEAMAHKVVPIAFNSYANVGDIITDGEDGLLVTPFNVDEYAEKISFLIENEEKRECMAIKGLETSSKYNIESIASQWLTLFQTLIHNK